jgi:hypothetical protein
MPSKSIRRFSPVSDRSANFSCRRAANFATGAVDRGLTNDRMVDFQKHTRIIIRVSFQRSSGSVTANVANSWLSGWLNRRRLASSCWPIRDRSARQRFCSNSPSVSATQRSMWPRMGRRRHCPASGKVSGHEPKRLPSGNTARWCCWMRRICSPIGPASLLVGALYAKIGKEQR